jgi:hypothetical protein
MLKFEDLFNGKSLDDISDEELIAKAQELRTRRKYPAVDKAQGKKTDAMQALIDQAIVKNQKGDK